MADDVRIIISGDTKDLEREYKRVNKIYDRFDKVNKRSSQRRAKQAQKTSKKVELITAAEVKKTMAIRRRMNRLVERDRKQREREAIRSERREARARERILRRHAARRRRIMRGIARGAARGLGLLGVGGGLGVIFKAREILKFDEVLARTSSQAKATIEQQLALRDAIHKTSLTFGASRETILETIKAIVDKLGEKGWELSADNLDRFAKIIRGMGTDPRELGLTISSLKDALVGMDDKKLFDFLEIVIAQGDAAKINLTELAQAGEGLFSAFLGAGFEGRKAFEEYGAFIQLAAKSSEGVQAASTSVQRFVTALIKDWKKLGKAGVEIYGKGGTIRDIGDILRDLFKVTGGDMRKITQLIPNIRGFRGLQFMAGEYRKLNGEMRTFNELVEIGANAAGNIDRKFRRVAKTAAQGFERMSAGFTILADKALTGVLNDIADDIKRLLDDPEALKQLEETGRTIGEMARTIYGLLQYGGKIGGGLFKFLGVDLARGGKIRERKERLTPEQQKKVIGGWYEQLFPGHYERMEKRLEEMEFTVNNNITIDEFGNITDSKTILNAQINTDRGLSSVQKSIRAAKMR